MKVSGIETTDVVIRPSDARVEDGIEGVARPEANGAGGQHQHRALHWVVAMGTTWALVGLAMGGLVWGRPQLVSELRTSDNHVNLRLVGGGGPFASWLLSTGSLSVGQQHGHRLVVAVPAGHTSRLAVSVASIWTSVVHLAIRVPPKPSLVATTVGGDTVTLQFSEPVTAGNAPCGLTRPVSPVSAVSVPRGPTACAGALHIVARSGEQADVTVSVPALPPPAPPPQPIPPSSQPAPVISFGPTANGAFYITIDDGAYPDPQVLSLMQQNHIPITAFLASSVAASHLDYWKAFLAAGGDIEDHTVSHPNLTTLSVSAAEAQWAGAAQVMHQWFGTTPTLGRPPGGSVNTNVRIAAGQAGLRDVVLWSASMYNGQLTTYDHKPLRAGEIVILHWIPGLYNSLVQLLAMASAQGLHPAALASALAQGGS
jgi:peptidoglycan/xylan/chitin deacetylase (PgdA/CDA1 family)